VLDLNHAERRALSAAVLMIGVGTIIRTFLAPGPAEVAWRPAGERDVGTDGATAEVRAALAREQRAGTPLAAGERIDPNTAPVEELRRLPRVGPALASAILAARRAGPFRRPGDLERVPGIGAATAGRLAPLLRFDEVPAPEVAVAGVVGAARPGPGGVGCPPGTVDINRAAASELERLPGVGPKIAQRIVASRAADGVFPDVHALTRVSGIGERTVARLAPRACAGKS
jgi:competence protein ComEA